MTTLINIPAIPPIPYVVAGSASGGYANPATVSVTVTATGGAIHLVVSPQTGSTLYSGFGASGTGGATVTVTRNGGLVARTLGVSGTNSSKISFSHIEVPPAGVHTYSISLPYCQYMQVHAIVY